MFCTVDIVNPVLWSHLYLLLLYWTRVVTHVWLNAHGRAPTCGLKCVLFRQDDEVVLQCVACIQKENRKFCLAAEGLGNRLCYLEPTSEAKVGKITPNVPHTCFGGGIQLSSELEKRVHSALLKEVSRMKGCIHCGENSMETRHPIHSRRGLVEVKSGRDAQKSSPVCCQSRIKTRRALLMSFPCERWDGTRAQSPDDNALKLLPWMLLMDCFINSGVISSEFPTAFYQLSSTAVFTVLITADRVN